LKGASISHAEPPRWHPLQALRETVPGHWELFDQFERKYGDITLVRRGGDLGYRCLVLSPHATAPTELDFAATLRDATERVQRHWVAGHPGASGRAYGSVI
jgi:hypothetical protein